MNNLLKLFLVVAFVMVLFGVSRCYQQKKASEVPAPAPVEKIEPIAPPDKK